MIDDAAIADGRHLRLMVTSPRRAPIIEVQVEVGAAITAASIGGQVLDLADFSPATTGELIFYASSLAADGFVLDLTLAAVGPVRITLADMSDGLPGPARVRPPIRCPRRGRPWMERWSEAGWSSEPGISQNKDSPKLAHKSHDTSHSSYRLPRVARAMTVLGVVILLSLLGLAGLLVVWSPGQPAPLVVLLVLHGGPGMPTFILYTTHPTGLEQEFKAVWWEQRCADMSFASDIPAESMTVDQLIADTIAVTNYLRDGFGQDKIYLLGHSWGSCLGIQVAVTAPELFHAYIGMGQLSGNPRIFSGVHPSKLRGHFQFRGGCDAADAHGRAVVIVSPEPLRGVILGLLDGFDDVLVQPLMPDGAVVSLDLCVLLGLVGLDVEDSHPLFLGIFHQLAADVFGAIVDPNCAGLAPPLDDPVEAADDLFGRQREVDIDHGHFRLNILLDQFLQHLGENPHLAPARPTIVEGVVRAIVKRCITPPQAIAVDENNTTQHPPVIYGRNPVRQWKEWLRPRHLLIRQPLKITHLPPP